MNVLGRLKDGKMDFFLCDVLFTIYITFTRQQIDLKKCATLKVQIFIFCVKFEQEQRQTSKFKEDVLFLVFLMYGNKTQITIRRV